MQSVTVVVVVVVVVIVCEPSQFVVVVVTTVTVVVVVVQPLTVVVVVGPLTDVVDVGHPAWANTNPQLPSINAMIRTPMRRFSVLVILQLSLLDLFCAAVHSPLGM